MLKISSTQNNLVKHIVKLREDASYRNKYKLVVISGIKIIEELALITKPISLFITPESSALSCAKHAQEIYEVTMPVLKKITGLVNPEPAAALFVLPRSVALDTKKRILVTECVADPGNLGTLMRSALAFGFEGIFLLGSGVEPFHEKVLRASRGALFSLSYELGDWDRLQELVGNKPCFVADIKGEAIKNIKPPKDFFLLLSNEAHGLSKKALNFGQKVCIPMQPAAESLNVSVAGAILMYCLTN
jgi:TrmH family RNA methyltransferase